MVETGYIGSVRDDLPHIPGRAAKTLRLEAGIDIGKNEVLAKVAADAGLSETAVTVPLRIEALNGSGELVAPQNPGSAAATRPFRPG